MNLTNFLRTIAECGGIFDSFSEGQPRDFVNFVCRVLGASGVLCYDNSIGRLFSEKVLKSVKQSVDYCKVFRIYS